MQQGHNSLDKEYQFNSLPQSAKYKAKNYVSLNHTSGLEEGNETV